MGAGEYYFADPLNERMEVGHTEAIHLDDAVEKISLTRNRRAFYVHVGPVGESLYTDLDAILLSVQSHRLQFARLGIAPGF